MSTKYSRSKKQEKNFIKAKQILARGLTSDNCRDWDNLFENGYNDANSLIWELYKDATINNYTMDLLLRNQDFLPTILSNAIRFNMLNRKMSEV